MLDVIKNATPHIPLLLYGAVGIGKTQIVCQNFDHTEVMLASTMVEEDIAGLPYREEEYDYRTIPAVFRNLEKADKEGKTTCLFLDELDKARRSVADTLLTLVASRKVGKATLPKNTVIIAAANPPEFGGGDGISDAMRSRFCVVEASPDVNGWVTWARGTFKSAKALAVISAVESGEVPLVDQTGEEMNKRITCPRTLVMMLNHIEHNQDINHTVLEKLAAGLLTANTSSRMLMTLRATPRDMDVAKKSHRVRLASAMAQKQPLRI